jgi:hypothetical protein
MISSKNFLRFLRRRRRELGLPMQKAFDKWFLPVLALAIGSLMVWALWRR